MPVLQSTALARVHYEAERAILSVWFRGSGRRYDYMGVPPEAYDALLVAPSAGAHFNAHIRDVYPCERVR